MALVKYILNASLEDYGNMVLPTEGTPDSSSKTERSASVIKMNR